MLLLYSFFFAAGVAAFAYSKFGRRVGYGNTQNIWLFVGTVFIVSLIVFYSLVRFFLP